MEICKNCSIEFEKNKYHKNQIFCSDKCKDSFYNYNKILKKWILNNKCLNCWKDIIMTRRKNTQKFCCKNCNRQYWRKNNPDNVSMQNKTSSNNRKNNPEKLKKYKEWKKKYSKTISYRFLRYISWAKTRWYNFELDIHQFENITNNPCYYCWEQHEIMWIDRKNNKIGYELENCVACCSLCNFMKNKFCETEFISQCLKIAKTHSKYHIKYDYSSNND